MDDDLLGGLGGDAPEGVGGQVDFQGLAQFGRGILHAGLFQADFPGRIGGILDDFTLGVDAQFAFFRPEHDLHGLAVRIVFRAGHPQRLLDGRDDDGRLHPALFAQLQDSIPDVDLHRVGLGSLRSEQGL